MAITNETYAGDYGYTNGTYPWVVDITNETYPWVWLLKMEKIFVGYNYYKKRRYLWAMAITNREDIRGLWLLQLKHIRDLWILQKEHSRL